MLVDRPRDPERTIKGGRGDGTKVRADCSWGEPSDPVPVLVRVTIEKDGNDKVIGVLEGPFQSLEDAADQSFAYAGDWFDRGNG